MNLSHAINGRIKFHRRRDAEYAERIFFETSPPFIFPLRPQRLLFARSASLLMKLRLLEKKHSELGS